MLFTWFDRNPCDLYNGWVVMDFDYLTAILRHPTLERSSPIYHIPDVLLQEALPAFLSLAIHKHLRNFVRIIINRMTFT